MKVDIQWLCELAKLEIVSVKLDDFTENLLESMKTIQSLPKEKPEKDPVLQMELREDLVEPSVPAELLLKNAKSVTDGCFQVPKTVE